MKQKCYTCCLHSSHLFFYSRFGTLVFIIIGLITALIAAIDISNFGDQIPYYNNMADIFKLSILIWFVYRSIRKPTCDIT